MVILNKLKASSLVESLTASVIIVLVFMIASFSFNNVFVNTIKTDDNQLRNRIQEITYFSMHDKLKYPFYEEDFYWEISGEKNGNEIILNINNLRKKKTREMIIILD